MEDIIRAKLEKIDKINTSLKARYAWSSDVSSRCFAALTFALSDKDFNIVQYDDVKKFIRDNTRFFSHYRSKEMITYPALLISKFDDPRQAFTDILKYEEMLTGIGFSKSPYLGIASYAMLLTCRSDMVEGRVKKVSEIYNNMKKNHFWLTGQDDYPLAVILSSLDDNTDTIVKNMEENFNLLHDKGFAKSGGLQFLSHILTFSSEPAEDKADSCIKILKYLKEHNLRIYPPHYSMIGLIALTGSDNISLMDEISQTSAFIQNEKCFKWLDRNVRFLISCSLSCNKYYRNIQEKGLLEAGMGLSMQAVIAAQTSAMVGAAAATSAAVAASTSH